MGFTTTGIDISKFNTIELKNYLFQEFWLSYELKVLELEIRHLGIIRALERTLILIYIDIDWKDHLQKMSLLRDAVGWRSYGQRNPLFEYRLERSFAKNVSITRCSWMEKLRSKEPSIRI